MSGSVSYGGQRIDTLNPREMQPYRRRMQMVFQDPYASLNPRMTVRQILVEPLMFHNPGLGRAEAVERGLTYLFISHDLSVVEHISTRVAVMYLGCLCELAGTSDLFGTPLPPYTRALLSAIPQLGQPGSGHVRLSGDVPTPINLPPACVFHGRCPHADERCRSEIPQLLEPAPGHFTACHAVKENRI